MRWQCNLLGETKLRNTKFVIGSHTATPSAAEWAGSNQENNSTSHKIGVVWKFLCFRNSSDRRDGRWPNLHPTHLPYVANIHGQ